MSEKKIGGRETTPPPVTLDDIAERIDFLAQATGILLLCQHGFVLPRPLLGGLCEQLGINLICDNAPEGSTVQ